MDVNFSPFSVPSVKIFQFLEKALYKTASFFPYYGWNKKYEKNVKFSLIFVRIVKDLNT